MVFFFGIAAVESPRAACRAATESARKASKSLLATLAVYWVPLR